MSNPKGMCLNLYYTTIKCFVMSEIAMKSSCKRWKIVVIYKTCHNRRL